MGTHNSRRRSSILSYPTISLVMGKTWVPDGGPISLDSPFFPLLCFQGSMYSFLDKAWRSGATWLKKWMTQDGSLMYGVCALDFSDIIPLYFSL